MLASVQGLVREPNGRFGAVALVVLGMHRSGTSSVAGALTRLGGAAPLNLLPPAEDNPTGFWESTVLVTLNDEILAAGGSHWEDWRQFELKRIDAAVEFELKARARSALEVEFAGASLPIVKDPRMCRLMSFWSPVFHDAGWSVRALLQLRSPLEVARSLERRNGIPLGLGCLIWLRHMLDAEAGTTSVRRAVVDWNDFLGNPRRTLERVGEQLNVAWPRWSDGVLAEIGDFVSADLRHQRASDSDLRVHPAVSDLVHDAYTAIQELVENPTSERAGGTLANLRERLDGTAGIFGHTMFELEEGRRRAQTMGVSLRNEYTAQLTTVQQEFARQISEASGQLAEARGEFERQLAEARGEFERQLAQAREEFATQLAEARSEFYTSLGRDESDCGARRGYRRASGSLLRAASPQCDKSALSRLFAGPSEREEGTDSHRQFSVLRRGVLSEFKSGRPRRGNGCRISLPSLWRARRPRSGPLFLHAQIFGQISRCRRIRFECACTLRDVWAA